MRQLESGDLIAVYRAGTAIAHIMLSFGFAGRDYVAVSIETRKERGESYSRVAGFFKQYELVYVVGGERDHPVFYNTLTTNCTTGVRMHAHVNPTSHPWSWKLLLPGYVPQYVYDLGRLDSSVPFVELERRSWVNKRAHAAGKAPDFSQRIRTADTP